jgi:hypothetical protein
LLLPLICSIQSCVKTENIVNTEQRQAYYRALYCGENIEIDGMPKEKIWQKAAWYPIDQCYLGTPSYSYSGRFKALWKDYYIFLLVEITDNNLTNFLKEGFENYWQGDCIEIFIDEDRLGGQHLQNNNAFAYHCMHTGEVIDIAFDGQAKIFPNSVNYKVSRDGNKYLWEMEITVYGNKYNAAAASNENARIKLFPKKKLGFTVAYGDNNGVGREAFYGSTKGQGDSGYITSDNFGTMELIEE